MVSIVSRRERVERAKRSSLPNDDRIAVAELIEHALKFRSLPAGAGELLAKDLLTTCFSECPHLQVQALVQSRHPRVADVLSLARDRGKSPCKQMNFCIRPLHNKISSKSEFLQTLQKLGLLQFYAQRNLDAERVLTDEYSQRYGTFRTVGCRFTKALAV
jgi:hypothetical protein